MTKNWKNELKNRWYRIEEQTILSLEVIKRDRIRKGLPFDEEFKVDFLRAANTMYEHFKNIDLIPIVFSKVILVFVN